MYIKVLAITDLTQANTDGFKNFIKVSNTNNVFHHFIINVPSDTKIKELSRRWINITIKKIFNHWFSFKTKEENLLLNFITLLKVRILLVWIQLILLIGRQWVRRNKIYLGNKWFYHSLSLKLSNFPYFIAIGNTFTKKFLKFTNRPWLKIMNKDKNEIFILNIVSSKASPQNRYSCWLWRSIIHFKKA